MKREVAADAFETLAHLFTAEGSMRRALMGWATQAPAELVRPLERLAGRLSLGAPLSFALGDLRGLLGTEYHVLLTIVKMHLATGADPSHLLRAASARLRADAELSRRGAAGLAGVRASARLVAGLPLACLVLFPLDRSPLTDPVGIGLLVGGGVLGGAGFVWMRRVVPTLDHLRDDVAGVCELMAGALRAGLPPSAALEAAVPGASGAIRTRLERTVRLGRLGSRLPRALELSGAADLVELGRVIDGSTATGAPLAPALEAYARRRRERLAADAERALRKAPVRMLPALALCVLPSFVLLGLGPFVRDLFRIL